LKPFLFTTRFTGKRGDKQDGKGNGLGIGQEGDPANTLTKNDRHAVAHTLWTQNQREEVREMQVAGSLAADAGMHQTNFVKQELAVRRLIPVECERLQGFPDNWTQIPWKKKVQEDCPDGPRFKAMGNSMAVPVMRWIGEGIELVNRIPRGEEDVPQQEELGWL
jgi:DNA (cytosine-5)-methyltransferase 1